MWKSTIILGNIGFAVGLALAFYRKTGFWAYIGYAILFSIIGSSIGYGIDVAIMKPQKDQQAANTGTTDVAAAAGAEGAKAG